MPPRLPVSPVSLETCNPSPSDNDADALLCSDDELDDAGRAAQRARIEKCAQSYLQGRPLYILSASLRGPFEDGWVNPWHKDRNPEHEKQRPKARKQRRASPSPVVQETNSRKRRSHRDAEEAQGSRRSVTVAESNADPSVSNETPSPEKVHNKRSRTSMSPTTRRPAQGTKGMSPARPRHLTPLRHTDKSWLRKDHVQVGFSSFEPPSSPTTSISSRHVRMNERAARSPSVRQAHRSRDVEPRALVNVGRDAASGLNNNGHSTNPSSPNKMGDRSESDLASDAPTNSQQGQSFQVLSSTSQLPKFEYRRRKQPFQHEEASTSPPKSVEAADHTRSLNNSSPAKSPGPQASPHHEPSPTNSAKQVQSNHVHNINDTLTSSHSSHTVQNHAPEPRPGNACSTENQSNGNTSEKLPSAQQVSKCPTTTDHVPSLYSIAMPKTNSEGDGDSTLPDPQFSTQAALLLAQRSFQHDLETPDRHSTDLELSRIKDSFGPSSRAAFRFNNITPFARLKALNPDRTSERSKAPGTAENHMMSTQYMIDAVTPFTVSPEKRAPHSIPTHHRESNPNERRGNSQLSSSPSPNYHDKGSRHASVSNEQSPDDLPMTLSGTTPATTAQDGQGGLDSFSLSQAIADAGSWLQQSFDFNRDLRHLQNPDLDPSIERERSAVHADTPG